MPSISFLNHLGALLTLWLLLCCGAPAAENGRILMVTEATFPPYEFRDGNTILGIDPEIMREVARRTGRELVIEDMSFDSVITAVVSGKADAAASGITVTPERRRKVDFSIPYVEAAQVIIVPKGSPIRKREDIRGKRIGVQHGATGDIYVTRNIQQPERFPNGALAVAAVAAGKVDAAVIDQDPAKMYVAGNERLEILPEPLTSESYAIAVRKGDTVLLQDINDTIAALKASGKLEEIRNAYAAMQVKSAAGPEQHASGGGWLENTWLDLKESFYVNFMQEGRWKYLTNGFLVTVEVSFFFRSAGHKCTSLSGKRIYRTVEGDQRLRLYRPPGPDQGRRHHPEPDLYRLHAADGRGLDLPLRGHAVQLDARQTGKKTEKQ